METNEFNQILLSKFDSLENRLGTMENRLGTMENRLGTMEKGQARIEGIISQMDKRFESMDKRFDSMESIQKDLRHDFRSLSNRIDTGLSENRSEIQNSRRFSFTLFCFALTFSAISIIGLVGKMFGLF